MENNLFEGYVLGLLGQMSNDLSMIKALNYVQLEQLAKEKEIPLEELMVKVDKMHAQYVFQTTKIQDALLKKVMNPDKPDSEIEDLLKDH